MDDENKLKSDIQIDNSQLYQEFLEERGQILRHKWLESEKEGRDIGFERALLDWVTNHRKKMAQRERRIKICSLFPLKRFREIEKGHEFENFKKFYFSNQ